MIHSCSKHCSMDERTKFLWKQTTFLMVSIAHRIYESGFLSFSHICFDLRYLFLMQSLTGVVKSVREWRVNRRIPTMTYGHFLIAWSGTTWGTGAILVLIIGFYNFYQVHMHAEWHQPRNESSTLQGSLFFHSYTSPLSRKIKFRLLF